MTVPEAHGAPEISVATSYRDGDAVVTVTDDEDTATLERGERYVTMSSKTWRKIIEREAAFLLADMGEEKARARVAANFESE